VISDTYQSITLLPDAFAVESPTLVHRLRETALDSGRRPCLYYGENALSLDYAEFDRITDQLAADLSSEGVGAGHRVALYTENALLSALVMFASWKLAAVYCPINAQLKDEQLLYILNDLEALVLVCDCRRLDELETILDRCNSHPKVIACADRRIVSPAVRAAFLDRETPRLNVEYLLDINDSAAEPLPIGLSADDVASIIYTSGTTSDPKGVIQRHSWLHALCATQAIWTHADDVIHCDLPMHHIGGAFSLFARGIWAGASIVLWDRFSASQYWQRIAQYSASTALLIDVMADWLLGQPESIGEHINSLSKVHMQPLTDKHRTFAQRFGIDYVLTGYGSSEVGNALLGCVDQFGGAKGTPDALWLGYSRAEIADRVRAYFGEHAMVEAKSAQSGLMGVPSGFYEVDISETNSRLLLKSRIPGVLFDGYLNRSEPDSTDRFSGRYLAPDIVSRDQSGRYYFLERLEGFLRVRGENVAAAAVEAQFIRHPAVRLCVAMGVPAAQGAEDDIVIVVQPEAGHALEGAELLHWADEKLPGYMQPRKCHIFAQIPLTSTMKIDRGALRTYLLADASDEERL